MMPSMMLPLKHFKFLLALIGELPCLTAFTPSEIKVVVVLAGLSVLQKLSQTEFALHLMVELML